MSEKRLQLKTLVWSFITISSVQQKTASCKSWGDQIILVPTSLKVGGTRPTGPIGWLRLCGPADLYLIIHRCEFVWPEAWLTVGGQATLRVARLWLVRFKAENCRWWKRRARQRDTLLRVV